MTFDDLGFKIGHASNEGKTTGCTVFLCPPNCVGSVDIRGPAPGSRESALLGIDKHVSTVHGVLLTGGSAFGLAAADGVMRFLGEQGIGHPTPIRPIPIVPAAVVYDLFMGGGDELPDAAMGYQACLVAREGTEAQGNVGAGSGVTVGKWSGFHGIMKGGFGLASVAFGDVVVAAAAVVNAVGDVLSADGTVLAGARKPGGGWMADVNRLRHVPEEEFFRSGMNTTLVVVATNGTFTKVEANRLAQRGHDGLAIALRPAHSTHDGDTVFGLATGAVTANFDLVANMAVEAVAEAIRNGVRYAANTGIVPGLAGSL